MNRPSGIDRPARQSRTEQVQLDTQQRCSGCDVGHLCVATGADETTLEKLDHLLEIRDGVTPSRVVVKRGDPFQGLIAVRSGCFKPYTHARDGREHVLGFFLPGELIGLDAIERGFHQYDVIALDHGALCELDFEALVEISACSDGLRKQLFRLFASRLADVEWRTGDYTADERLAAFLLDISERLHQRGRDGQRFELPMSRSDIGSYLSLATETVSRVLSRFQKQQWIAVRRKQVSMIAPDALSSAAEAILESR